MLNQLKERAQNRWKGILPQLGIDPHFLTGRHMNCPVCGEGKDRFRFDDKEGRGTWYCNRCGAGDGLGLVKGALKVDFREAARLVEAVVEKAPSTEPSSRRSESEEREAMNRLWRGANAVTPDDPTGLYLRARGIAMTLPPNVMRTAPLARHMSGGLHPAMLVKITASDGRPVNVHRTFLAPGGGKAAVDPVRMIMSGRIPKGSSVRLLPIEADRPLGIAEGIETALSAAILHAVPCWAALNTSLLATWEPPDAVRGVIIFGDNDAAFAGQAAAYVLAKRLAGRGRTVKVMIPDTPNTDWNDVLKAVSARAA